MIDQRVLITTDVVGGVWDFSLLLASQLRARHAAQVTLLALGEPHSRHIAAADEACVHLLHTPVKLEWMQDSEADVARTGAVVAEVAHAVRADVVHANQFAAASATVHLPVVLTLHSDVLSWSRWTVGRPADSRAWGAYARLVEKGLRRAQAVVSVSNFLAREVADLYRVDRAIDVIHNGWPANNSAEPPPGSPITLLAGRLWDAAKNVDLAARAARGWDPGDVFLAGETVHPATGARTEVAMPLQPLGFLSQEELSRWLQHAAIYLSPARYDPFGLLPLQAALNGCALLLSDIPSYRELWDGAACFFRSDDAQDLRRKWRRLVKDADLRADLWRRAARRAYSNYTPSRMADRYVQVYTRVQQAVAA